MFSCSSKKASKGNKECLTEGFLNEIIENKTALFAVFLVWGIKHYAQMSQKENNEFIRNIKRRVAELRLEKGLTQAELAEKMDIDIRTLQKWECDYITLKAICKLTEVLSCSPYDFFKVSNISRNGRGRPRKIQKN